MRIGFARATSSGLVMMCRCVCVVYGHALFDLFQDMVFIQQN